MPDLGAYLASVGGKPWVWNGYAGDCCTFPADWRILQGHPDPMAKWRGAYDSEESCTAFIEEYGSLFALWVDALGAPDEALHPGAIGVLTAHGHDAGGIWTGEKWAIRTVRGWAAASPQSVDIWGHWNG